MARFPSNLLFGSEARNKLLRGVNILAKAVSSTLGPKGRNVAINQSDGAPSVIHDGVSVAKRVDLFNEFEDMGAQLLKQAAIKTSEIAGDGTTLSTILGQAIIVKGFENIEAGANPMTLKREVEEVKEILLKELKKLSKDISTDEEAQQVATVSAVDPEIGKLVAEAVKKTGDDGIVTVEQGEGLEIRVEYKQGMEIDRGYLSPGFVTDQERVEAIVKDADILITDVKMNRDYEIVPFLNKYLKNKKKNLVIIGETLENALATLVINKLRGVANIISIQPPAFGGRQLDELEDIAILTGGSVIRADSGRDIESVQMEELGHADKVISDRDKTRIIGGAGTKEAINQKVNFVVSIKYNNIEQVLFLHLVEIKVRRKTKLPPMVYKLFTFHYN